METIKYDDFAKLDLRVARIINSERVEKSEKLINLEVDAGDSKRQIVAGVGKNYEPEDLIGKNIIIVANLEPRTLMGLESQGMLLAASEEPEEGERRVVLLTTMDEIKPGSNVG